MCMSSNSKSKWRSHYLCMYATILGERAADMRRNFLPLALSPIVSKGKPTEFEFDRWSQCLAFLTSPAGSDTHKESKLVARAVHPGIVHLCPPN